MNVPCGAGNPSEFPVSRCSNPRIKERMKNNKRSLRVWMRSAVTCLLALVNLAAYPASAGLAGSLKSHVGVPHCSRRARLLVGWDEGATLHANRPTRSCHDLVERNATIVRVRKENHFNCKPVSFPTDTRFPIIDNGRIQFGFVDWKCVLLPLRKVIRLN